ncbi:MAG: ABC transporter substrate-binding protein [bacterium]|nr:ABC transporter substrate-binding protein [bacterium]
MRKKLIASILAASMVVASLSGCSGSKKEENNSNATPSSQQTSGSTTPLVVGYNPFSEKFSPFFHNSVPDQQAQTITQVKMATFGRDGQLVPNAKDGQTVSYNGKDYTYNGLSNLAVNYDKEKDITTYNLKIRDDVTFSDGEKLTADDIIFTFYVACDPAYDGSLTLGSRPIVGLKNYRANSTAAESITAEEVAKVVKEMPKELKESIKSEIIKPTLESEFEWAGTLYNDASYKQYTDQYKKTKDLFAFFYSVDKKYDSTKVKDDKQVIADIVEQYGVDYQSLAKTYQGDNTYFDAKVTELAQAYLVEKKKAAGEGEDVKNIEGIKKISDTEVEITTNGFDASMVYQFDLEVAPMHYYGDKSQYDYDNNKFGFTRGDLSKVKEKTTKPMGAGPYKFVKYENKIVYFEANENYYLGAPKIKSVQFKEATSADKTTGLVQGTIDLTDPTASKTTFQQIKQENSNGELTGDKIAVDSVDNLGYGYMGINATNVCVGDDSSSTESKNLRKALATIFSVYRDVAIDTYYGDAASVINYPISNTSWAAPKKSDSDYQTAFSKDVNGADIYTDSMSADEKYAAAKKAALGYLEAAGYTVKDGKVTAAPKGARLKYEVLIGADGTGDHPTFAVLTDAKAALKEIGIDLTITDFSDTSQLWTTLDGGKQDIWVAAWQATPDPDMYQVYHSDNIRGNGAGTDNRYEINDKTLDELILAARKSDDQEYRKTVYKECLNTILDWAVEIPVYQRLNCIAYSPERVNSETMTPGISPFYEWFKEIEKIEMK